MKRLLLSLPIFLLPGPLLQAAPKVLPVLNHPIANRQIAPGAGPQVIDLNAVFGAEPIDDQVVRFTSNFTASGQPVVLDMALFSNRTPITRTNFLKYVSDGDYTNSFVHRSVPGFVIQGGGFRFVTENGNNTIANVPVDPAIMNEFAVANTLGTISMAKVGNNLNSATSQWFVNTAENSDFLGPGYNEFTVFGRVTRTSFSNALIFNDVATFPIRDKSVFFGNAALTDLPLFYTYNGTSGLNLSHFIYFPTVALASIPAGEAGEVTTLTYSMVSSSNPAVATTSLDASGRLKIEVPSGATGSTTLVIRATDSVGNTVEDQFVVTAAKESFATWRSRAFNHPERLNDGISGPNADPDGDGLTNLELFVHGLMPGFHQNPVAFTPQPGSQNQPQFSFPIRNDITGGGFVLEQSSDLGLADLWKTIPATEVSRIATGSLDQISLKSASVISTFPAFFRVRFTGQ